MRLTVHIPDEMKGEIQKAAQNEHKSMSLLVSEAIRSYLQDKRRKVLGQKVMEMVGESAVTPDVHEELERGRMDDPDRL
jgi:metal-responsive CopG/Arc/MetJ family transcriptional regulator